jgi:CheY-like chemotaxis protein
MAKILIVDDTHEILVITKMILEKGGHEVEVAKNSKECFEKIKEKKPDLMLLDVMISKNSNDGWDICRKIKEDVNTRDILVVMFTVRTDEADKELSRACGADAHIDKPFRKKELLNTVEDLIKNTSS